MTQTNNSYFIKRLLTLVFPIAFQQFMLALVSASDALMLGALTQNALSAVSLAGQITFVHSLFLAAMTIGLSTIAAQYWGKGDVAAVERIFAYVFKLTAVISFAFSVAAFCVPALLMRLFTPEQELIAMGAVYLRSVSLSYLLTGVSQIFLCTLKNSDRAVKSSIISSASVLINIVLNAVLIFGLFGAPKMEIAGAALATVIARIIEVTWCIAETAVSKRVQLRARHILHNDSILRHDFWKYSAPVLGNEIVWGLGFTMYSVIMGHLGSDAVAANAISNIAKNLIACFCIGLGSGGSILIGNELGAGKLDTARQYGRQLCILSLLCGAVSGVILLLLSSIIPGLTNLSPQAAAYLRWMLIMCSYYMVGKSITGTTIAGIFCAGGDTRFGLLCDTVTMWCFTVPLGLLAAFVFHWPVPVVYFIVNLDELVKLPAVYRHYKKYRWVKDLTVTNSEAKSFPI